MNLFSPIGWALFSGVLLYGALCGTLRFFRPGSLRRPVRTEEAVAVVAVGSTATQVFATHSVGVSLLVLGLLSALACLGRWLSARFTTRPATVDTPPTLLLYRGCLLPDALADVSWSEAELRQRLRAQGVADLEHLHAVVLEANGRLGVIQPPVAAPLYPLHVN